MLPVTTVVVFMTFARSPRVLLTNKSKVIDWRDANPNKEGYALARKYTLVGPALKLSLLQKLFNVYVNNKLFSDQVDYVSEGCKIIY